MGVDVRVVEDVGYFGFGLGCQWHEALDELVVLFGEHQRWVGGLCDVVFVDDEVCLWQGHQVF